MKRRASSDLEVRVRQQLDDPAYDSDPMRATLAELWRAHLDMLDRIDRITRVSDGYQSMAREREQTLMERCDKQLRKLEKLARISDGYQGMMRDVNVALKAAATHDALTGLANRRLLIERLRAEVERSERNNRPFSLAMVDIDHFKQVNDMFGHEMGDTVLVEVARAMSDVVREYDLCGRWGGEEFLVLLPDTDLDAARAVLERVRESVKRITVGVEAPRKANTISAGLTRHHVGEEYGTTLHRADEALLRAKLEGRDRCEVSE